MRDFLLLGLFPFLVFFAFRKPFIGLALWLWTSLVPTHIWAYGIATSIKWNMIFAGITIIGFFLSKNNNKPSANSLFVLLILFFLHATLSTIFNIGFDPHVWQEWEYLFKSIVFFIFVVLIVHKKIHIEALMWACVFSISIRAAGDGVSVLLSGGGHVVRGLSPTFPDNNLSALATLMCLPMLFYLYTQYKQHILFKAGLLGLIFTNVLFVLGSDSRGGFLGLLVLAGYFFVKSKKKVPILIGLTLISLIGLSVMDNAWFDRMNTIQNANQDGSFMSRVVSWKVALLLAIENPIFGGGFDAAAYKPTWQALVLNFDKVNFIPSPEPKVTHVSHSIYFQVLGDLGFIGLILFLIILNKTYQQFNFLRKSKGEAWLTSLGTFMTLSIVAFAVSGAALNAAYNEIFLMLVGLAIATSRSCFLSIQATIVQTGFKK